MTNIVFLGKFIPQNILKTIKEDSKGKIGLSNHNFEMSIINGLCLQEGITLKCISCPGVFSFPHNNKKLFTHSESYDYKNTHIDSAGFCNIVGINEIWSTLSCAKKLLKAVNSYDEDVVHVIIDTPNTRLYNALKIVRKISKKKITRTIIIPDIPALVSSMDKDNYIKKQLVNYLDKRVMTETANADGLVLLTEAMMDFVSHPVKHVVMEGIVDVQTMDVKQVESISDKQVILYTGTLRKMFGVMNLVEAFLLVIDPNVELWICGSGDSKEEIEEYAMRDPRIKFFGLVDSRTALEMQHKATILVNPRTSVGEYTKYSFPSKTMEYLLAGKSVIVNKLPGIPSEYYDYVYTPKDESISAFAECITAVLHMEKSERDNRALAGRDFIINKKNSKSQMARVLDMIRSYGRDLID